MCGYSLPERLKVWPAFFRPSRTYIGVQYNISPIMQIVRVGPSCNVFAIHVNNRYVRKTINATNIGRIKYLYHSLKDMALAGPTANGVMGIGEVSVIPNPHGRSGQGA
jgi:hypothetical protein|tara:strand:- start:1554 stop:1877 length:324 start_codon:yes stop_codon:yes gene_type:complete